jgi:predicted nucleic acid-binding protein
MCGTRKISTILWDSCIFIAWFNGEADKPLAEIERILRSVTDGKANLLVSAICLAEVLDLAGESDAGTQFRGFIKRPNVILANVDHRVGALAGDIRVAARAASVAGLLSQSVKIPDALIAATAIIYKADELHTFDPVLLEASTLPALGGLNIIRPQDSGATALGF